MHHAGARVTPMDSMLVVAYYAWCMAGVSLADAPARARKGAGRYPQPIALLARLGVDVAHEGRGLGAGLLQDVIARTHLLGEEIGAGGLSCTPRRSRRGLLLA